LSCYVLGLEEIDQTQLTLVGGKAARLGELSRIEGVRVPAGFCVTTEAFQRIMGDAPSVGARLERLARLQRDDRDAIRTISARVRQTLDALDESRAARNGQLCLAGRHPSGYDACGSNNRVECSVRLAGYTTAGCSSSVRSRRLTYVRTVRHSAGPPLFAE